MNPGPGLRVKQFEITSNGWGGQAIFSRLESRFLTFCGVLISDQGQDQIYRDQRAISAGPRPDGEDQPACIHHRQGGNRQIHAARIFPEIHEEESGRAGPNRGGRPQRSGPDHPFFLRIQAEYLPGKHQESRPKGQSSGQALPKSGNRHHRRNLHGPGRSPGLRGKISPLKRSPVLPTLRGHSDGVYRRPVPASPGPHGSAEKTVFGLQYDTPYFFSARILSDPEFSLEFVELEKIYRQTDADFIGLLNAIRNRSAGRGRTGPPEPQLPPGLCPRRGRILHRPDQHQRSGLSAESGKAGPPAPARPMPMRP